MTQDNSQLKTLPNTPTKSEVYKIYNNKNIKGLRKFIQELQIIDNMSTKKIYLTKPQFIKVLQHFGVPEEYQPFREIEE